MHLFPMHNLAAHSVMIPTQRSWHILLVMPHKTERIEKTDKALNEEIQMASTCYQTSVK